MWEKFINIVKWFFQPFFGRNLNHWKVVGISFLTATTFWFFNQLNKSYNYTLEYPIRFEYYPSKVLPVHKLPENIKIAVLGNGWDIWRESRYINNNPIIISIDSNSENKVLYSKQISSFFNERKVHVEIKEILTDTLSYSFDKILKKKIKLTFNTDSIFLKNGYCLVKPFTLTPDTIEISGPKKLVKKLNTTQVIYLHQTDVDDDIETEIELKNKFPNLKLSQEKTKIEIQVSSIKTKTIDLPYTFKNCVIDTSKFEIQPRYARVEIKYPKAMQNEIQDSLFVLQSDFKNINIQNAATFPIVLKQKPESVLEATVLTDKVSIQKK